MSNSNPRPRPYLETLTQPQSDTFTVGWTTIQTLLLVVSNHDDAGGESLPSVYERFLNGFHFIILDSLASLPGA